MNGQVLQELPVAVDFFQKRDDIFYYFLSHMHSDHTVGLSKAWREKLYCSETTAKLLHRKLEVPKRYIVALEVMQPYMLKLQQGGGNYEYLAVTLIPANHCPGSCMFLFETSTWTILYTADFRPSQEMYKIGVEKLWGSLHKPVDILYLDNTYCEPACEFPSRAIATDEIVKICRRHPEHIILIAVCWTGHEDLLVSIAMKLRQRILVSSEQFKILQLLETKDVFTTDSKSTNIRAVPRHFVTHKTVKDISEHELCIGILPTAKFCHQNNDTDNKLLHLVPYSNHASFSELWKFVQTLNPQRIRPVVPGRCKTAGMESIFRANMSQFDCLLAKKIENSSMINSDTVWKKNSNHSETNYERKNPNGSKRKAMAKRVRVKLKHKPCGVVFDEE